MESVVASVRAVLASASCQDERHALSVLVASDGAPWPWPGLGMDGPHGIDELLVYVVARAFAPQAPLASVFKETALGVAASIPALSRKPDGAVDASLLLERLVRSRWPVEVLQRLCETLAQIDDPRVRHQAIRFGFRVLGQTPGTPSERWIQQAIHVLLLGVTDVWSAVRKPSARAAAAIAIEFPALHQVDAFVSALIKTASGSDWKAQEGALLTLTAIVSCVQTEASASSSTTVAPRTVDLIKAPSLASAPPTASVVYHLGRHRGLAQLPRSLAVKLKPTLYTALKHNQLSVREAAAVCFVRYVEICDEVTRVLSFQEVMSKLNRLAPEVPPSELSVATLQLGEETDPTVELLDAAEAEGLLDVLAKLVPHLPVAFLVKHWKLVFPTLERYVVHIASTVRLRSSAVVLALAELSLSEASSTSIELLYQMLLAVAETRRAVGVGWQQHEGRLLSVDLLVGLLGRDRLWRVGARQNALHLVSRPRPSSAVGVQETWLPDSVVTHATWTLDEEEQQRFQRASLATVSIIERLNALARAKSISPSAMWQRVLGGWLRQTREAYDSPQFELRRIARQALPGLVWLCVWCEMLPLVREPHASPAADSKTNGSNGSRPIDAWTWSSLRYAVLHVQLVRESGDVADATTVALEKCTEFVRETIRTAPLEAASADDEPEGVVARVEALLLANLSLPMDSPAVAYAIRDVHNYIPRSFQLLDAASVDGSPPLSRDGFSLDRQLTIALVPLLPAVVNRLVSTRRDPTLWHMTERVTLSWLATDDMLRWITIDKLSAQVSLLQALLELLASPDADSVLMASDEVASIIRTLETAIPLAKLPHHTRLVDALVRVYSSLWRFVVGLKAGSKVQEKVLLSLALLHNHISHTVTPAKSEATKSEWDDWDGDGESEAPVDDKHHQLRASSPLEDPSCSRADDARVATTVASALSPDLLDALASQLQRLLASDQPRITCHHDTLRSFFVSIECHSQQLST